MSSSSSQILHMISIITTIFFLLSLQTRTHIAIAEASLTEEYLKLHGLQKFQVEKVAGEDDNERKEALILQKFRALLGLKSFRPRKPMSESFSPSPSPLPAMEAESPAPAPAPKLPVPVLYHPPLHHHSNPGPKLQGMKKEDTKRSRFKKILVAVLVSVGAAFFICVLGVIWVSVKLRKNNAQFSKSVPFYKKNGRTRSKSRYGSSQKSANKSSLNPSLDLLYLSSLGRDLEQQNICLKQSPAIANTSSNHSSPKAGLHKREDSHQELIEEHESDNASSSSTREIMSVHEDFRSVTYDSHDGGNSGLLVDEAVPVECHDDSSGDESFHSFVDTHSSQTRLSSTSAGSPGEIPETSCTNLPKRSPSHPSTSKSLDISSSALNPDTNYTPPLPPPPPPPPPPPALPPSVRLKMPRASSWSSRIRPKSSSFSTLSTSSSPRKSDYSPRKSDSSPRCNQTTQIRLPSSPRKSPKPRRTSPSIPSPPCPPPFMKGNSSRPPPPPAGFPQYTPLGKDGTPLPKLKPLHWDKVRAAPDRTMVWDKIRSSSFELDEEMIESLFGYNLQTTVKNDEIKSKTPSLSKHVLEPKRLQNITILLKALNATAEQVCDALIRGDGLSLQQLEALAKMIPTKEEESKLTVYKGDINELGSAERLVRALLSIPFAFLRVEAMLYRETFEDEVVLLRNSFSILEEACKELRSSRLFLKLLEAVLKTGNRMNVGTIRGGARAFKLDTLLKLADVKGTDGRTTLLHFVVQEIIRSEGIRISASIMGKLDQKNKTKSLEEKEEDYRRMGLDLVAGLSTELYNVKKTATIDIDVLASSVANLSDGMEKLKHLVTKNLSGDEKNGSFVESTKNFLNYAEKKLEKLKVDEDKVLLHVREITEYFHGDVSKDEANPLRIFVIVRDFLGMLDHVCKELRCFKVPSSPNPLAPFG